MGAALAAVALAGCAAIDPKRSAARAHHPPHHAMTMHDAVPVADGKGESVRINVASVVDGGLLTGRFGERRGSMGGGRGRHTGIDVSAPAGTPVRAAAAGRVVEAGRHGAYGRLVRIRHSPHLETAYAHLSRFADQVGPGRWVNQGEVIGHVGTSGRTTGPHLHFELIRFGRPVDPLSP
jgi:murein DD-endopeptidase MepM/ murein hydrolase activator NlpD